MNVTLPHFRLNGVITYYINIWHLQLNLWLLKTAISSDPGVKQSLRSCASEQCWVCSELCTSGSVHSAFKDSQCPKAPCTHVMKLVAELCSISVAFFYYHSPGIHSFPWLNGYPVLLYNSCLLHRLGGTKQNLKAKLWPHQEHSSKVPCVAHPLCNYLGQKGTFSRDNSYDTPKSISLFAEANLAPRAWCGGCQAPTVLVVQLWAFWKWGWAFFSEDQSNVFQP